MGSTIKITPANRELISFLYDKYSLNIYKIICTRTEDPELRKQLLLETFILIAQDIESFEKSNQSVFTWMAGKAVYVCLKSKTITIHAELLSFVPAT